ncbi:hypothetical protein H8R13_00370 [Morganella morganii]|uniref:hypothetical protein n=1 Tax=Morganella morganii TaxID=582 RepID=UPI00164B3471|nr:hypothetical protein [Morganella morganii]MBC4010207.1 hypothetical protein [Morganella morganii]MCF1264382.1 hypothetical protein [Morganella morganii]
MSSNNEITLSELHDQSDEIIFWQKNIEEIPFPEQLKDINIHQKRTHKAIDRVYDTIHKELDTLPEYDFSVDVLKQMQSIVNELYAFNHDCYNAMQINELTEKNTNYIYETSALIDEYIRQVDKLKKIASVHIGEDNTNDTIDILNKKINDLRHTLSEAVKFAILLSKINTYMLNTLSVTGFWVQLMAWYEPYFRPEAPADGLDDIIRKQTDYFHAFGH